MILCCCSPQVLYNMFTFVADLPVVDSTDVFLGVARFFVVAAGGVLFGLLFGFVAAFTTRFTHNVRPIEPLFVFMYSYLAYLVAECFAISSVLAYVSKTEPYRTVMTVIAQAAQLHRLGD